MSLLSDELWVARHFYKLVVELTSALFVYSSSSSFEKKIKSAAAHEEERKHGKKIDSFVETTSVLVGYV